MEDNVGTIVIGTKVDNKGLEKDLKETQKILNGAGEEVKIDWGPSEAQTKKLENEFRKAQKLSDKYAFFPGAKVEREDLEAKIDFLSKQNDLSDYQIQNLENYKSKLEEVKSVQEEMIAESGIEYDFTGGYTAQIEELQWKLNDLISDYNTLASEPGFNEQSQEARELEIQIEKVNNQLDRMKEKQKKLGDEGFKKMEKGFSGLVKKAGKLALALIGIRTIINLITRSFNTLAQYNEELGTKMEQMRLVLAVALEPIINWLVNMLQVILTLINQITTALLGINLFGRASELWSQKMAKNMASGAGSAKEMKKQLAGFDEMNVLNDNQAGGGGAGGGTGLEPWMLEEKEPPEWMKWILKNGSLIAGILTGVGVALLLIKLGVAGIMALGIGVLIAGIVMLIMDLIDYLKDPTWEKFGNIIRDIGVILIGLGIIIGNIPLIVIGAIVLIVGLITKYWEQIKGFINGIGDWFKQKAKAFEKGGNTLMSNIYTIISLGVKDIPVIFETLIGMIKGMFDGLITFIKGVFTGDWKMAWEGIKKIFTSIWDALVKLVQETIKRSKENFKLYAEVIKEIHMKICNFLAEKVLNVYNYVKGIIDGAVNFIINKFNAITNFFRNVGVAIGDFIGGAVRGAVNGALSFVEGRINNFISMINNVISIINKIPGVSIGRIGYISLPRMAVGGIINQPGRGVPVGGAIAGESGREGILPLTDKQAMAELGREIGKWISIQATVPVNIGNRQVARVIQELNNDREFAMNS